MWLIKKNKNVQKWAFKSFINFLPFFRLLLPSCSYCSTLFFFFLIVFFNNDCSTHLNVQIQVICSLLLPKRRRFGCFMVKKKDFLLCLTLPLLWILPPLSASPIYSTPDSLSSSLELKSSYLDKFPISLSLLSHCFFGSNQGEVFLFLSFSPDFLCFFCLFLIICG